MSNIRVGIYTRERIRAVFHGEYKHGEEVISGEKEICEAGWYIPMSEDCSFSLMDVTIGIDFHWERNETQTFKGSLEVMKAKNGELTAVNVLDIEDYLQSVISSEMSATSHMELLKAHAVISRSWALCKIQRSLQGSAFACQESEGKRICWYGSEPHEGFDVCADDHCQRYEGITRRDEHPEAAANVQQAIDATRGQVLMYDGKVCDARFYKSCGGATELFENAWAPEHYDYLEAVRDEIGTPLPDLTIEENAQEFIRTSPSAYCNTTDERVLGQVLNNYDQETKDFYRWTVQYTKEELSEIIRERSGIDFGEILNLVPIKRGPSARLYEMQIVGSKRTMVIGKELEIRKWLSRSHLYSSAFVVDRNENGDFILTGAGWGHGVGLCQIGAAVMADKGYTYEQILAHYFPGSELKVI